MLNNNIMNEQNNNKTAMIPLENQVVSLLRQRKLIITTAESCTGGLVGAALVNVSGASSIYHEGYITYSNEAKMKLLGVSEKTLNIYKAVSRETAHEMAEGCAQHANADVGIAVTGVAGPSMEDDKPVGLVYIGCYYKDNVTVKEYNFTGDRQQIRNQAVKESFLLILSVIK